jgi:glycerol kinase
VGFWQSREEIAANWQVERRFEGSMSRQEREALYAGWKRAVGRSRDWVE